MTHMNREELLREATRLALDMGVSTPDPNAVASEAWWRWILRDGSAVKVGLVSGYPAAMHSTTITAVEVMLIHDSNGTEHIEQFRCDGSRPVYRGNGQSYRLHWLLRELNAKQDDAA